jgi:uncharacterized protein (TIGR00369 family)
MTAAHEPQRPAPAGAGEGTSGDAPAGPAPSWGAVRSRTIQWHDPLAARETFKALSGLEILEGMRAGRFPRPPMLAVFDIRPVEVATGLAVFECRPDESMYNPLGTVHGGVVCTLADTAGACAVHTTLPAGATYTSVDIAINYLRPVTVDSGVLRATGRIIKPGRRIAVAGVEVTDAAGKLVATASTTCLVLS